MRHIVLATTLAALAAGCASTAPSDVPGGRLVATSAVGATVTIPESQRAAPMILRPGSTFVATLDSQMRFATITGGLTPATPPVPRTQNYSATQETRYAVPKGETPIPMPPAGQIEFLLWSDDKDGTMLVLKNNTQTPLVYVAALLHGAVDPKNMQLTTICPAPAGKTGFENWHEKVDAIVILRIIEPPPSKSDMCIDPSKDPANPTWYALGQ